MRGKVSLKHYFETKLFENIIPCSKEIVVKIKIPMQTLAYDKIKIKGENKVVGEWMDWRLNGNLSWFKGLTSAVQKSTRYSLLHYFRTV